MSLLGRLLKSGAAVTLAAATTLTPGLAWSQDTIALKLGHYLPTVNYMHKEFLEPWARDLEACSNGKVAVEIFPAGTQLGQIDRLYDAVQAGVLDLAFGVTGIPSGRFDRVLLMELPYMTDRSAIGSQVLWKLFPEFLEKEFPGVKVLALSTTNGGQVHTASAPVNSLDDLKGLRIRFPSGAIKATLEFLGATPVGLPAGQAYENLQRNVIDGTIFTWDSMEVFKLAEVTKHHLDNKMYVASFWFGMNQKSYDSLPEDVRACVDKLSGQTLVDKFGAWWDAWDKAGHGMVASSPDHVVVVPTEAEQQAARERLQPMIDQYIAGLEQKGIDDARAIYDRMKEEIAAMAKQ